MPGKTFTSITGEKAQREFDDLFAEVGKTTSAWMEAETQIQQTFRVALGGRQRAANGIFNAAINLNARLAMTNEAVTHALNVEGGAALLDEWNAIYAKAKKLAKRRNAVAHGAVTVIMGECDENGVSRAVGARVIDPLARIPDLSPQRRLAEGISSAQLEEMRTKFHKLAYDLFTHQQKMHSLLEKLRESPEP